MLADSISAFSAGLTCATARETPRIRPEIVPSRPTSVITFGEGRDVVGALFPRPRHDFHHAFLSIAASMSLRGAGAVCRRFQAVADDLADRPYRTWWCSRAPAGTCHPAASAGCDPTPCGFPARARIRTMNRSIAIDKPEGHDQQAGVWYMNQPQFPEKNLTIVSNVFIA